MNKLSFYIKITMLMVLPIGLEAADIEKGKISVIIGLILVLVFMVYYWLKMAN